MRWWKTIRLETFDVSGGVWKDGSDRLSHLRHRLGVREIESVEFTLVSDVVNVGDGVKVHRNGVVTFEGIVYERRLRKDADGVVSVQATAYSNLILYDRFVVFRYYPTGTRAGTIVKDLASLDGEVDLSEVEEEDTPALSSNWVVQNETALKVMLSVASGTNHLIRMKPGKRLYFRRMLLGEPKATLDESSVSVCEYSEDRWRLRNRVIYLGSSGEVLAEVSEGDGSLPTIVHDPFLSDPVEARRRAEVRLEMAKQTGRELRVELRERELDRLGLDVGDCVSVNVPGIGMMGEKLYVYEIEYDPLLRRSALRLGGKLETFEDYVRESLSIDAAARFGRGSSTSEVLGMLTSTIVSMQAVQKVQSTGKTVRYVISPPLNYDLGSNVVTDGRGRVVLASGFVEGTVEFSCLPTSDLFTRWLRAVCVYDRGEGDVRIDVRSGGELLFANVPSTFDLPYYPRASGQATSSLDGWRVEGGELELVGTSIVGSSGLRVEKTSGTVLLSWPASRDMGWPLLRYFRIYLYSPTSGSVTVRLLEREGDYVATSLEVAGGRWAKHEVVTTTMPKIGSLQRINWIEVETSLPVLYIDSDYLLLPLLREKFVLSLTLSRGDPYRRSPRIDLVKFVWREGR